MKKLVTTLGTLDFKEIGIILPHEHVFVDLRTSDQPGYAQAEKSEVIAQIGPEICKASAAGVSAIVECSTVGVGRRADILRAVSQSLDFPLVVPTGVYREPWIPKWVHEADENQLQEWMTGELTGEIEDSGVKAGWIKLSAGDDGLTECEKKVLRSAAVSAKMTGAVIGSHTVSGTVVREQLDIIEKLDCAPERFVWIHTQAEIDFALHLEMAKRGAWLEYDGIGSEEDDVYIQRILRILDAGYGKQLLLSQDRGWYDPAALKGGIPKPYTYMITDFLPKLIEAGVDKETVQNLVKDNPFRAFAR